MNLRDTARAVYLLENDGSGLAERLKVELCSWLERHRITVMRGDQETLMEMYQHQTFVVIIVDPTTIAEGIQVLLSDLRERTEAKLICLSGEMPDEILISMLGMELDEILNTDISLSEAGARVMKQMLLWDFDAELRQSYLDLNERYELVLKHNEELEFLSKADALTGLFGRRYMMRKLQEEAARTQRSGHNYTVLIGSLDGYEALEEQYGKAISDRIIKEAAAVMTTSCRTYDIVARWSDDQFMLLLPETDMTWALVVAGRCRRNVERYQFSGDGSHIRLKLTVGMSEFRQADGVGGCIRRSEYALRESKMRGGNCIVFSSVVGSEISYTTYQGEETPSP
ncbi:MAG: GGDEF domain-containing protein [Symbiobacteriaceae bacterium]|nr:GGDEF domain-containing protein [Symbiobacteriaceae bacterium]